VKRIGIVVVAYNAASTLASVLDRIPDEFIPRISGILVCDNHSEDPTYLVGVGYQQSSPRGLPITVIRQDRNLGYGGNQKTGYRWAMEQDFDIAVLLHADGQYAPELLPQMVEPLDRGETDAVFGSRMMVSGDALRGGMPLYKYVGNKILSSFENRMVGTDLSEWHSGYRAYSVDALRAVPFENCSDDYDFDTGIILAMHEAGRHIVEIPIPTFYGDEISYVNGMRYAADIARDVVRYRAQKLGMSTAPGDVDGVALAPGVAEGPADRLSTWLSARPPGRVLVASSGAALSALETRLDAAGHDVVAVDLDGGADVESASLAALEQAGRPVDGGGLDAVVATGLLERCVDPDAVLRSIRAGLRPGGVLALAVPNVGHWYPRMRVATGRFGYERDGVLARPHLRFFTRDTLRGSLQGAGLRPRRWEASGVTGRHGPAPTSRWSKRVEAVGLGLRPGLVAATWLVEAVPASEE
jgi:SAM-dependent methyltransferase